MAENADKFNAVALLKAAAFIVCQCLVMAN
jgi:hypothetical protein